MIKAFDFRAVKEYMEPIAHLPLPLPAPNVAPIASHAIASFGNEIAQLIAMTKNEKLPIANLGAKVDIKV